LILGPQVRAARLLLGWSQAQLSSATDISIHTIQKFEKGLTKPQARTVSAMRDALELAGIDFMDSVGVHLRPDKLGLKAKAKR
jgi:transcriptional regulator with XRE-family HTH domain